MIRVRAAAPVRSAAGWRFLSAVTRLGRVQRACGVRLSPCQQRGSSMRVDAVLDPMQGRA